MLEPRPNCECCDRDLTPEPLEARICSFECTFCSACAAGALGGRCPNCGGELVRHPVRPAAKLTKFPAATARKHSGAPRAQGWRGQALSLRETPSCARGEKDWPAGGAPA
jgi:hypothetical protein